VTYVPSPNDFVADHVRRYESTDGIDGGRMRDDTRVVVLHTVGRRTCAIRKSPLIRVRTEQAYVAIASMGGAARHPAWYLNLVANPQVRLQDRTDLLDLVARTTEGEERRELWAAAVAAWPDYEDYQAATKRRIPVVALEVR
jgi:deazaflavin-dependent oxidoreductase (nitroreductase family)